MCRVSVVVHGRVCLAKQITEMWAFLLKLCRSDELSFSYVFIFSVVNNFDVIVFRSLM